MPLDGLKFFFGLHTTKYSTQLEIDNLFILFPKTKMDHFDGSECFSPVKIMLKIIWSPIDHRTALRVGDSDTVARYRMGCGINASIGAVKHVISDFVKTYYVRVRRCLVKRYIETVVVVLNREW